MSNPFYSGPIAPERNPPINPQYYQPSRFVITDLAFGPTTIVTTAVDHNYVIGQIIRLCIPITYGAQQLNQQEGNVLSIPAANQVVVTINSTQSNAFIADPSYGPTPPQIIAVGDYNSGAINTSGRTNNTTYIQGSFINISPE